MNSPGAIKTPADFLPQGAQGFHRTPAWVDGAIMMGSVDSYLAQTVELLRMGNTMTVFDGYSSHVALRVLARFAENVVIICALPSHTSRLTQPLDVSVFCPMKGAAKDNVSAFVNNQRKGQVHHLHSVRIDRGVVLDRHDSRQH